MPARENKQGEVPQGQRILFFCYVGLMRAPLYLGDDRIVPGVSTLPLLLGIAIFKRFHDLYGIPPHVTHLVVVFLFRANTDLPWRSSRTTSLQIHVMSSCARQWLETARAKSTRGVELFLPEGLVHCGCTRPHVRSREPPLRVKNPLRARWVSPPEVTPPPAMLSRGPSRAP